MIRLKVTYSDIQEKDKLLEELKGSFQVLKVSREYKNKKEGPYKRIHVDLSNKKN